MKILITGSNGMLAKAIREKFKNEELICTDVNELDITNKGRVVEFVKEHKPQYIINCAAYTAVDKAEEDEELAEKINADGPRNLAIAAKEINSTLIHISTDYVFSGELDVQEVYKEEDITNPVTAYGRTKLHGEQAIIENMNKYYIFRTAWLYGDGNNFVRTMMKLGKEKEEVNVVADQHGSPTYTEDLTSIISQAIDKNIPYGVYHTTNIGYTTWFDFTKKIYEIAGIDCKVNPVTSEEFVRPAKRPNNSKLSKDKILKEGIKIPSWEEAVERFIKKERIVEQ